jgi:ABC-type bacteriocin/lantibiotic exporter with double-glycine peptidase domain
LQGNNTVGRCLVPIAGGITCALVALTVWGAAEESPAENRTCGAEALEAILRFHSMTVPERGLTAILPNEGRDSSLDELAEAARQQGLICLAMRWQKMPPKDAPSAILPVTGRDRRLHFVAVLKWEDGRVLLCDGQETGWLPSDALRQIGWEGVALHLSTASSQIGAIRPPWWQSSRVHWSVAAGCCVATLLLLVTPRKRAAEGWKFLSRAGVAEARLEKPQYDAQ